jgi:hypothetical protein
MEIRITFDDQFDLQDQIVRLLGRDTLLEMAQVLQGTGETRGANDDHTAA